MGKIKFRDIKMSRQNQERLSFINEIIQEYQEQNYILTLRQLYYQLVSRDVIPNKQNEYAKLSNLLKEGRMAGIVDWDAIEDRLRKPDYPAYWESPASIIGACINQYRKNRQKGQNVHVEVWVEKDALSGVLKRVTEKYGVPIMVNRGYSSVSAMFDSYERFYKAFKNNQSVKILYLGDFDPSGLDMIRDIKARIDEFITGSDDVKDLIEIDYDDDFYQDIYQHLLKQNTDVTIAAQVACEMYRNKHVSNFTDKFNVLPIALTIEQIRAYNPPPNPAKITDPRAKDFMKNYGGTSWEVDALKPQILHKIVEDAILKNIDIDIYNDIIDSEQDDIEKLEKLSENM